MAKRRQSYRCVSCGEEFSKWLGRCPACGEWNSIEESLPSRNDAPADGAHASLLSSFGANEVSRLRTGLGEFDLVCGGGIVPGSVILVGGEPGIGKSTLALQIAGAFNSLYISGEESPAQLRQRADRLEVDPSRIAVSTITTIPHIQATIEKNRPECVVVDSIQTLSVPDAGGVAGSVSQIRESTARLIEIAKKLSIPVLIVGHITKDGYIAGPKMLEHLVDTVLYFEGDFSRDYRLLRSFKNRFGSINEIGLFRMSEKGLEEIADRNSLFLNPYTSRSPGSAVSAAVEGSRIILFEVQALVSFTSFSNPRRMADGFDANRAILIAAVLEKHAGLKLSSFDLFINVAGGFTINETAADIAVAAAIASSLREKSVPDRTGFLGEISLSGEVRPVTQCRRRVAEFIHAGFETLIVAEADRGEAVQAGFRGEVIGVKNISAVISSIE